MIERLETHVIAGKLNASNISEVIHKLSKGQKKFSQGSNVSPCLALLRSLKVSGGLCVTQTDCKWYISLRFVSMPN